MQKTVESIVTMFTIEELKSAGLIIIHCNTSELVPDENLKLSKLIEEKCGNAPVVMLVSQ